MGCGKTVFTKGIAQALDISEEITSPTYTLVSEYNGKTPLYHMDLYRITSGEEFEMLGVEELLDGEGVTVIEWFHHAEDVLPDDIITVEFEIDTDGSRIIRIIGIEL